MTAIINSLGKLFSTTWTYMRSLMDWGVRTGTKVASDLLNLPDWVVKAVSAVTALVTVILGTIEKVGKFIVAAVTKIGEKVLALEPQSFDVPSIPADVMAGMNTFFPLQELFAFLVGFFALYVLCAAIRMLKAWIPTVS